jgi:hypothetical protein
MLITDSFNVEAHFLSWVMGWVLHEKAFYYHRAFSPPVRPNSGMLFSPLQIGNNL